MKKQILKRALWGIPIGITIASIIAIIISYVIPGGGYSPCVPELITQFNNEITAVTVQTILAGLLGAVFSAASLIWEIDRWSIAKQTGIYFIVISAAMLPVAYINHWMQHTLAGFLIYLGIFLLIFMVVWISLFMFWKKKIDKLNRNIRNR